MPITRNRRKALLIESGVKMDDVAKSVPCSAATVSRVVCGLNVRETPRTRKVKVEIARRLGIPVSDLWPEPVEAAA